MPIRLAVDLLTWRGASHIHVTGGRSDRDVDVGSAVDDIKCCPLMNTREIGVRPP
jgi:hypothetical protein